MSERLHIPDSIQLGFAQCGIQSHPKTEDFTGSLARSPWKKRFNSLADMFPGLGYRNQDEMKIHFGQMVELGATCHRDSLRWDRVHIGPGRFDENATQYIEKLYQEAARYGLSSIVTVDHFEIPGWIDGGWANKHATGYFLEFIQHIVPRIKENVWRYVTHNEPMGQLTHAHLTGYYEHGYKSVLGFCLALKNMSLAHLRGADLIRKLDPKARVGCAHGLANYVPATPSVADLAMTKIAHMLQNDLSLIFFGRASDTLMINPYYDYEVTARYQSNVTPATDLFELAINGGTMYGLKPRGYASDIPGVAFSPEGLIHIIEWAHSKVPHLPVILAELGIANKDEATGSRALLTFSLPMFINELTRRGIGLEAVALWTSRDTPEWGIDPEKGVFGYRSSDGLLKPSGELLQSITRTKGIDVDVINLFKKLFGYRFFDVLKEVFPEGHSAITSLLEEKQLTI